MAASTQLTSPARASRGDDVELISANENKEGGGKGGQCLRDTDRQTQTSSRGAGGHLPDTAPCPPRLTSQAASPEEWMTNPSCAGSGEMGGRRDSLSARPQRDAPVSRPVTRSNSLRDQRRPSFHNVYCRSSCKTRPPSPDRKDPHQSLKSHSPLWRTRSDGPQVCEAAGRSPLPRRRSSGTQKSEKPASYGLLQVPGIRSQEEFCSDQDMRISTGVSSPARTRRISSIVLPGNMSPFHVRRSSNFRQPGENTSGPARRTSINRTPIDGHFDVVRRKPSSRSPGDRLLTSPLDVADLPPDVETHSTRDTVDTIDEVISTGDDDLSSHNQRQPSNSQSPATTFSPPSQLPAVAVTTPTPEVYYPPYKRLERLNHSAPAERRRKMAVALSPVENLTFDIPDVQQLSVDAARSDVEDEGSGHLQELKHLTLRLNLDARRPSVFAWRRQLGDLFARRSCSRDGSLDEAPSRPMDARWSRIGEALQKLRNELLSMQQLDQELARTLIALRRDIHNVKLQMSYARHQEDLEEAIEIEEQRDDLGELCDDLPDQFSPALRNCGVTRMNIHSRRFSVF